MMRRLLALFLLSLAAFAHARTPIAAPHQPIILRLEGHFTADRDAARAQGADAISLRIDGAERWFAVDTARNMSALSSLDGRDVLAALAPFHPSLTAMGDAKLRRRLADAGVGDAVRIEGLVDRGSRTYLLRDAALVGDAAGAVPPGSKTP